MLSKPLQNAQLILNVILIALLIAILGTERVAKPVSAAEPQAVTAAAVPGGPGYVMIPATAFYPERPTDGYLVFWGEVSVPVGSPNGYTIFYAPVYLPQGARLTGLTMYYRDTNDDGNTLGVDFYRKELPGAGSGEGVGLNVYSDLVNFSTYQSDTTPDPTRAVVDNSQYAYWIRLYVYAAPSYLQLQAVRIDYTYTTTLPDIRR